MNAVIDGSWGTWKPMCLCEQGLDGATLGIVGLKRIGFVVAKRVRLFSVDKILYFDTEKKNSDFVFCCSSSTPENNELFDARVFNKMKKSAGFIKTSRGGLCEPGKSLSSICTIGAAGLDDSRTNLD
ncbi:hypothetical protein KUTeg_002646 [Tegillarca granosa]|uniref:D-isomer specific 2-hydroxyacid dehydrogenase NAD-binding domain-containing protein n=1 Tax=Tegillarca granosa TaxID=220873 RepID=A0ABQ9FV09_TEGGR|nr:hypothetical protein KUTeg_002646 [Tegillarca granosa]